MHCPRCHATPPSDPFVCTSCGEHLLTYLDEPLGPGTGVADEALGDSRDERAGAAGTAAGLRGESGGARGGSPDATRARPTSGSRDGGQQRPSQATPPGQSSDVGPVLLLKLILGAMVSLIVIGAWPPGGFVMLVALALVMWRWPRLPFLAFAGVVVGIGLLVWIVDDMDVPGMIEEIVATPTPVPTATVQRPFATTTTLPITRAAATRVPSSGTPGAAATSVSNTEVINTTHIRIRWLRGDSQGALDEVNPILLRNPKSAGALNLRALIRIAAGDFGGAADDARQATQLYPFDGNYHDTLGYALLKMGRHDEALGEYIKALDMLQGTDRAAPMMGRGLALAALGRNAEAQADILGGTYFAQDLEPNPQLDDLEASARQAFDRIPRAAGVASPVPARPAPPIYRSASSPVASPIASPAASRDGGT